MKSTRISFAVVSLALAAACGEGRKPSAVAPQKQTQALSTAFAANSLIIATDETLQTGAAVGQNANADGTLLAFGLVDKLLRAGIPVNWVATTNKTQATTDITVNATERKTGTVRANAAFKAGPFVVDSAFATAALMVVDAWQSQFAACTNTNRACITNVWVANAGFSADVRRVLTAAPHIAVFIDGNEDIAFGYLNAALIPDSAATPGRPRPAPTPAARLSPMRSCPLRWRARWA